MAKQKKSKKDFSSAIPANEMSSDSDFQTQEPQVNPDSAEEQIKILQATETETNTSVVEDSDAESQAEPTANELDGKPNEANETTDEANLQSDEEIVSEESSTNADNASNVNIKKKKGRWKRRLLTFGIIILLGVVSGAFLANWYKNYLDSQKTDYSSYAVSDFLDNVNEIVSVATGLENPTNEDLNNFSNLARSHGKTPLDFTPSQNYALAAFKASLADSYSAIGIGDVDTVAHQTIYSAKKFDGNKYTFESVSLGLLSVAICTVETKDSNKVSVVEGQVVNKNQPASAESATWTGKTTDYTENDFKDLSGVLPSEIMPYIISSKTILEEQNVTITQTERDGKQVYEYSIALHPIYSVLNYHKQVKFSSNLSDSPTFSDITIKIIIDGDWNFVRTEIVEHYTIMYGISAKCTGTLATDYTFNEQITLPL